MNVSKLGFINTMTVFINHGNLFQSENTVGAAAAESTAESQPVSCHAFFWPNVISIDVTQADAQTLLDQAPNEVTTLASLITLMYHDYTIIILFKYMYNPNGAVAS